MMHHSDITSEDPWRRQRQEVVLDIFGAVTNNVSTDTSDNVKSVEVSSLPA